MGMPDAQYFDVLNETGCSLPILLHLPHSSSFVPEWYRPNFCLSDEELRAEQLRLVDSYTDELYAPILKLGAMALKMGVSRYVTDPERYEQDKDEAMSQVGMGVFYTATTLKTPLRAPLEAKERERLLSLIYRPYHAKFTELTERLLAKFGRCIIIDGHSFQSERLPYEINSSGLRPNICIGTDPHHTSIDLIEALERTADEYGYSHAVNSPFAGTMVPLKYYGDARVSSLMIEINRALYMDEKTGARTSTFTKVENFIAGFANSIRATVSEE